MGEKYELRFLSDKDNSEILLSVLDSVSRFGWVYNIFDYGKYSYWQDGPIWQFGESIFTTETKLDKNCASKNYYNIVKKISKYYSPSMILSNKEKTTSTIAIVETTEHMYWKDVLVSFDYNDLMKRRNETEQLDISHIIKDIFVNIAEKIRPHYAFSALETRGVVEDPSMLRISEETLGDFNYFSIECKDFSKTNTLSKTHEYIDYSNVGRFVFTSQFIGKQA